MNLSKVYMYFLLKKIWDIVVVSGEKNHSMSMLFTINNPITYAVVIFSNTL